MPAQEWYLYNEPVRPEETRALLLRLVFTSDDVRAVPVVRALIETYDAQLVIAAEDGRYTPPVQHPRLETLTEAQELYARTYARELGQAADPEWPAALPMEPGLPRFLVVTIARARAQRDRDALPTWRS